MFVAATDLAAVDDEDESDEELDYSGKLSQDKLQSAYRRDVKISDFSGMK